MSEAVREKAGAGRRSGRSQRAVALAAADVELSVDKGRVELRPAKEAGEVNGALKALVRDELAGLDAERRTEIVAELAGSPLLADHASAELSGSLYKIREILRERLPACEVDGRQPVGLAVEQVLAVDERSVWVSGWMHDEDGKGEVTFVSPEGARVRVSDDAFRFERPDVVQFYAGLHGNRTKDHGFTAFFELPAPSLLASGWIAELKTSHGVAVEVRCPDPVVDPLAVRAKILGELGSRGPVGG